MALGYFQRDAAADFSRDSAGWRNQNALQLAMGSVSVAMPYAGFGYIDSSSNVDGEGEINVIFQDNWPFFYTTKTETFTDLLGNSTTTTTTIDHFSNDSYTQLVPTQVITNTGSGLPNGNGYIAYGFVPLVTSTSFVVSIGNYPTVKGTYTCTVSGVQPSYDSIAAVGLTQLTSYSTPSPVNDPITTGNIIMYSQVVAGGAFVSTYPAPDGIAPILAAQNGVPYRYRGFGTPELTPNAALAAVDYYSALTAAPSEIYQPGYGAIVSTKSTWQISGSFPYVATWTYKIPMNVLYAIAYTLASTSYSVSPAPGAASTFVKYLSSLSALSFDPSLITGYGQLGMRNVCIAT